MQIRSFSSYVETGNPETIDLLPSYSYYSESDGEFRWRDLYTYGFIDEKNIGVDINGKYITNNNIFYCICYMYFLDYKNMFGKLIVDIMIAKS